MVRRDRRNEKALSLVVIKLIIILIERLDEHVLSLIPITNKERKPKKYIYSILSVHDNINL